MNRGALAALLLLLAWLAGGAARALPALAPLDASSPRATFLSFQAETARLMEGYVAYRRDKSAERFRRLTVSMRKLRALFDLSAVAPATRAEVGGAAVVMLHDILLRLPPIDPAAIPGDDDPPDAWRLPGTALTIARMTEGPDAGRWLFDAQTVERLPEDHALALPAPLLRPSPYADWRAEQIRLTGPLFGYDALSRLPPTLQAPVLDTPAWKVALIALLYGAVAVATLLWARLARGRRVKAGPTGALLWRLTTPLGLMALISAAQLFATAQLNLSGDFAAAERLITVAAFYLATAWAAALLAFLLVEAVIASPWVPEGSYDAHLLRLVARVGASMAAGAIVVYGANDLGIPALGLVAGLGVGGFALALAAQSTVENLFGGVSIFADKPFRVGDFISYGAATGVVEGIGPRSSRLRGLDGTLTTVPNADLAKMHVTNYSMRDNCQFHHVIGLRCETAPDQLDWLMDALRRLLAEHPMVETGPGHPRVRLVGFGASSLDVELRAHVLTTSYPEFLEVQEALMLDAMRLIARAGSGFAFPSQTAYLARDEGLDADRAAVATRAGRRLRGRPETDEPPGDGQEGPDGDAQQAG